MMNKMQLLNFDFFFKFLMLYCTTKLYLAHTNALFLSLSLFLGVCEYKEGKN
jgi:hypothetical protein